MPLNYTVLPLSEDRIKAAYNGSPDIYREMIEKYGKDKVTNNYLIDVVVLQEAKSIYAADGRKLDITRELIEKVYYATTKKFDKWYHSPINKMKQWVKSSDYLGYIPFQLDHDLDANKKQGYFVGGSFRLLDIDGKLHLLAKAVLITPESKYNWSMDLWREISPGINIEYVIDEVSFVTVPADINNSTFATGTPQLNGTVAQVSITTELDMQLDVLKRQAQDEKLQNSIKSKTFVAEQLTKEMINKGIISSSKRKTVEGLLLQLSSGQAPLVADMLGQVVKGSNPLTGKPRTFLLKGAIDMGTREERFAEFQKKHGATYGNAIEMMEAFDVEEGKYQESLKLGSGTASLESVGKDKYKEMLELFEKDENVDDEIKSKFIELCKAKFGMQLSQPGTVDAGGVDHPNNATSLGNGAPGITDNATTTYTEMLEKGYATMKGELAATQAAKQELETKYNNIKAAIV